MKRRIPYLFAILLLALVLNSCSDDNSSSGGGGGGGGGGGSYSAAAPSGVMGAVGDAVSTAGSGLSGTRFLNLIKNGDKKRTDILIADNCSAHGEPENPGTNNSMSSSDPRYPGIMTYCKMSMNDGSPDTVQGAFSFPKKISCALERAGITWDGASHPVTLTLDTNCFSAGDLADMGMNNGDTMAITVTASNPATNSYFDRSVAMVIPGFGTYTLMTKVSTTLIEFLAIEDQTVGQQTKEGAFAGSLNLTTGELRYEGRMDRLSCTGDSSCGWARHIRVYADLAMTDGTPTGLESIAFGMSDIQNDNPSTNPQLEYSGRIVTASGNLITGIAATGWNASDGSSGPPATLTDYNSSVNWLEVNPANPAYCFTTTSETASTCGTPPALFSALTPKFIFNDGGGATTASAFKTAYSGMTFTAIDLDHELPW